MQVPREIALVCQSPRIHTRHGHLHSSRSGIHVLTRPGVERNFWPIIVCQLFCFSE